MREGFEIELIDKNNLAEFAENVKSEFEYDIPISKERAVSQTLNPCADDKDILLIVAREGKRLLSFMGAYPSFVANEPKKKIWYVSCWWKAKGVSSDVSRAVLEKFLSVYGKEIALPHLPGHIIKTLKKYDIDIYTREGLMIRFRSGLHKRTMIRSRKGKFKFVIELLRSSGIFILADHIQNFLFSQDIVLNNKTVGPDFRILQEIPDQDFFEFCNSFQGYLTIPGKDYLKWILENPWLVHSRKADPEIVERYNFSYLANKMQYFFPVLKFEDKIVGAGIFSNRDGAVKSLFLFIEKTYEFQFFQKLVEYIQETKEFHSLITYDSSFVEFLLKNKKKQMKAKNIIRYSGTRNPAYKDLIPADGDGDSCFT